MADSCDVVTVIQNDLLNILCNKRKIKILTESKTLFILVINNTFTKDRRLLVDIKATREAYKEGIVNCIIWIRLKYSLSDTTTKDKIIPKLVEFLQTSKVKSKIE